jgi:GNAT superfamily N-acetyltransferase
MNTIDESKIELVTATTYYLEMVVPPAPQIEKKNGVVFAVLPKPIAAALYRSYYYGVGKEYNWLDRMILTDDALCALVNADTTTIYIIQINGVDAGFAEFVITPEFVEIQYFGLMPAFVGKGWGQFFLQWVVAKAVSFGKPKIQLNTCTLDHKKALPNYLKAGFTIVRQEQQQRRQLRQA